MPADFQFLVYDVSFFLKCIQLLLCLLGMIYTEVQSTFLYSYFFTHIGVVMSFTGYSIVTATIILAYVLESEPPKKVTCLTFLGLALPTFAASGAFLVLEYYHQEKDGASANWPILAGVEFGMVVLIVVDICVMLFWKPKTSRTMVMPTEGEVASE